MSTIDGSLRRQTFTAADCLYVYIYIHVDIHICKGCSGMMGGLYGDCIGLILRIPIASPAFFAGP